MPPASPRPLQPPPSGFNPAANNNNSKSNNKEACARSWLPAPPSDQLATSNHRCCAERRLLDHWVAAARRHGVAPHKTVAWVRRKLGGEVVVFRMRSDGALACATPCVLCHRELVRFDLRVNCSQASGAWFSGRLSDSGAPQPVLTRGQRRTLNLGFRIPTCPEAPSPSSSA